MGVFELDIVSRGGDFLNSQPEPHLAVAIGAVPRVSALLSRFMSCAVSQISPLEIDIIRNTVRCFTPGTPPFDSVHIFEHNAHIESHTSAHRH